MSRRDVIILSVLINTGLLAILFVTAWQSEEVIAETPVTPLTAQETAPLAPENGLVQSITAPTDPKPVVVDVSTLQEAALSVDPSPVATVQHSAPEHVVAKQEPKPESKSEPKVAAPQLSYVEVTVKRGDYLGRIASANGVTVEALMKANQLKSAQLQVGQVLKVPKAGKAVASLTPIVPVAPAVKENKAVASADDLFYTIQRGDNPWSIARKFQISHEDLLKWNQLNDEGARNLQAGQRLRVRKS